MSFKQFSYISLQILPALSILKLFKQYLLKVCYCTSVCAHDFLLTTFPQKIYMHVHVYTLVFVIKILRYKVINLIVIFLSLEYIWLYICIKLFLSFMDWKKVSKCSLYRCQNKKIHFTYCMSLRYEGKQQWFLNTTFESLSV